MRRACKQRETPAELAEAIAPSCIETPAALTRQELEIVAADATPGHVVRAILQPTCQACHQPSPISHNTRRKLYKKLRSTMITAKASTENISVLDPETTDIIAAVTTSAVQFKAVCVLGSGVLPAVVRRLIVCEGCIEEEHKRKEKERYRTAVEKRIQQMQAKCGKVFGNLHNFVRRIQDSAMAKLRVSGFLNRYRVDIEPAMINMNVLRRFMARIEEENRSFVKRMRTKTSSSKPSEDFTPAPYATAPMPHVVASFHGTPAYNYNSILERGLLPPGVGGVTMANGRCYGSGIYSAVEPSTSLHYTRSCNKMFICGLLTNVSGTTTHGNIYVSTEKDLICPLLVMNFCLDAKWQY